MGAEDLDVFLSFCRAEDRRLVLLKRKSVLKHCWLSLLGLLNCFLSLLSNLECVFLIVDFIINEYNIALFYNLNLQIFTHSLSKDRRWYYVTKSLILKYKRLFIWLCYRYLKTYTKYWIHKIIKIPEASQKNILIISDQSVSKYIPHQNPSDMIIKSLMPKIHITIVPKEIG